MTPTMAALIVNYEDHEYLLDLEDMDTSDARAMERFGVPNLRALEEGISTGDVSALTVTYWLMLKQNGEPGVRLERVQFKPVKFIKSLIAATSDAKDEDEDETPKED
jgi:hypothetical protein